MGCEKVGNWVGGFKPMVFPFLISNSYVVPGGWSLHSLLRFTVSSWVPLFVYMVFHFYELPVRDLPLFRMLITPFKGEWACWETTREGRDSRLVEPAKISLILLYLRTAFWTFAF